MKSEINYLIFAILSKEKSRLVIVLQRSDVTEAMVVIPAVAKRARDTLWTGPQTIPGHAPFLHP